MKFFITISLLILFSYNTKAQLTPYEKNGKNYTATYEECISYYKLLAKTYPCLQVKEFGKTDAGLPLHLVFINAENNFYPQQWKSKKQCVLLINNGIHPGEPDGIDASMMLARDVCIKIKNKLFSKNVSIAIIPVYNIGGMLLRDTINRPDQNGPALFGARGNGQNLDLNRDFIKCDSKEAISFAKLFQYIQPTLFIDNHVSDGADYTYTMTLATTQKDKLGGILGNYLHTKMEPSLYKMMQEKNSPMIPYVNVWGWDARKGWTQFFDSPRYSSGYATLFNTLAFVPESHMLKPYPARVQATYTLMDCFIKYATDHHQELVALKAQAIENMLLQKWFPIYWKNDKSKVDSILFKGYTCDTIISKVSKQPVMNYNRNKLYTCRVPFYNTFTITDSVQAPNAYIVNQAFYKILAPLYASGVDAYLFQSDTMVSVEQYSIVDYKSSATPYEGHHANKDVKVKATRQKINVRKGDYYITTNQLAKRFIIETLEPHAMDSYFSWNFFDAILIQKEGFTSYAFEEIAAQILANNDSLKTALQQKVLSDTTFAKDAEAQLQFVFDATYHEPRHNVYPVYRVIENIGEVWRGSFGGEMQNKKDE
jgi:hypothetical protein